MFTVLIILATFISNQSQKAIIWVDDFNGKLSASWKGRNKHHEEIYSIQTEGSQQFLNASSLNSDNFIAKKIKVDITEYPYLNWKWRVRSLPVDGDESIKQRCDNAASIAVVLNASRLFPKSIKYSWSSTLAKGTTTESPYAKWPSRCDIKILESGDEYLNEWQSEKVNLLEDYKMFYKNEKTKSKKIFAIVIMSDSDNTGTLSAADYDDIFFSKT